MESIAENRWISSGNRKIRRVYIYREREKRQKHHVIPLAVYIVLRYKQIIYLIEKTTIISYKIKWKAWKRNWTYLWLRWRYGRWRLLWNTFPLSDLWRHSAFGRLCGEWLQERVFRRWCLGRLPRRMLKTSEHMNILIL